MNYLYIKYSPVRQQLSDTVSRAERAHPPYGIQDLREAGFGYTDRELKLLESIFPLGDTE
jgi:hypothetical protein